MLLIQKRLADVQGIDKKWRKYYFYLGFNFELCRPWYWQFRYDGVIHNLGFGFGYFWWDWRVCAGDYSDKDHNSTEGE